MTEIVNGLKEDAAPPFARGMLMPDNPNFAGGARRGCKAMPARRMVSTARGGGRETFAPGCRNSWHSHEGGQLLLCTSGRGYYQEKGKPIRLLLPGEMW